MKLFQYQPINKFTLQNLILQKVWAANPRNFNDPFEFVLRDSYRITKDGKIEKFTKEEKETLARIKEKLSDLGVTCLSECEDSILLWSHYTASHTGMCLTFDVKEKPKTLFKVEYSRTFPEFMGRVNTDFHKYLVTKGEAWQYEKEHRLIFTKGIGHYDYPGELTEITLGCKTEKSDVESIFKIVDGILDNKVLLSKASIDVNSFMLSKETLFREKGASVPRHWKK